MKLLIFLLALPQAALADDDDCGTLYRGWHCDSGTIYYRTECTEGSCGDFEYTFDWGTLAGYGGWSGSPSCFYDGDAY